MNDIELIRSDDGFDWKFSRTDVSDVTGNQRLRSAVIHAVLLRRGELEQSLYDGLGSSVHEYAKILPNEESRLLVEGVVEASVCGIMGVRDATARVTLGDDIISVDNVLVELEDGGSVNIEF